MSTELSIIREENVELIIKSAPLSYRENQQSHDACIAFGQNILNSIQASGMTDDLDQQAALFIEKAKKTVKKMNEKRSPITKLFDEIRTVYTGMENDIDPSKSNNIPAQLQGLRNEYAAKKRAEAEALRREEERKQRAELAKNTYRLAVEEDYKQSFRRTLNAKFNELTSLNNSITLENFTQKEDAIKNIQTMLPDEWCTLASGAIVPLDLSKEDAVHIRSEVINKLLPGLKEQYAFDIGENKESILLMLPSKKKELETIAQSSAEEARRREEEMKAREAEEARRREEEMKAREEEEKRQQELKKQQNEMSSLFAQSAAAAPVYQQKLQVKKKMVINNPLGFLDILNLWWATEGCTLTVEDLTKKFKSQITHCEKLANDKADPRIINSKYISYEEDVKAK